jgi:signal peptidase I
MSEQQQSAGFWAELVAFLKTLVVILGLAFLIRVQIVEPFKIPSGSMKNTLQIGDYILVLKFWYGLRVPFVEAPVVKWHNPQRGDVVVFTRPDDPASPGEDDSAIHIIKRVIGLPGETVEVRGALKVTSVPRRCRPTTFFFSATIVTSLRIPATGRCHSSMMVASRGELWSYSGRGIVSRV